MITGTPEQSDCCAGIAWSAMAWVWDKSPGEDDSAADWEPVAGVKKVTSASSSPVVTNSIFLVGFNLLIIYIHLVSFEITSTIRR